MHHNIYEVYASHSTTNILLFLNLFLLKKALILCPFQETKPKPHCRKPCWTNHRLHHPTQLPSNSHGRCAQPLCLMSCFSLGRWNTQHKKKIKIKCAWVSFSAFDFLIKYRSSTLFIATTLFVHLSSNLFSKSSYVVNPKSP